jgi:hypothetical protein
MNHAIKDSTPVKIIKTGNHEFGMLHIKTDYKFLKRTLTTRSGHLNKVAVIYDLPIGLLCHGVCFFESLVFDLLP